MAYQVVVEDAVLGLLTDSGELVTDNPFLQRFSGPLNLISMFDSNGGSVRTVNPGDDGYVEALVDVLEDAGYGIRAD